MSLYHSNVIKWSLILNTMVFEDKSFGLWKAVTKEPSEWYQEKPEVITLPKWQNISRWPEISPHVREAKSAGTVILGFTYFHPRHFVVSFSMHWWCRGNVEYYALNKPPSIFLNACKVLRFMYLVSFRFNHQWRKYISLFSREFQALSYTWQFNSLIL